MDTLGVKKICKDCGAEYNDLHDVKPKCEHCMDRDQNYTERAIQAQIDTQIDQQEHDL